ncbi:hypothetical protein [Microvirga puerhi]|uniref:Uncharacterized protein n=1 Tax=Microvirga puerhi TaxID=2876078 RepID=A0ABS7VVK9_9HYPH|nr:hypothetical protein [Microvirga puerhi]MBZ6078942.1 hypothetical protein [Microvirga puerhi]
MNEVGDRTLVDVLKDIIQLTSIWADSIIILLGLIGIAMSGHGALKLYRDTQLGESGETWGNVLKVIIGALITIATIIIARVSFIFTGD